MLQHIGVLYGRNVDRRYTDLQFTHKIFNCNPAGNAVYAFAFDGRQPVGCYTAIPMEAVRDDHCFLAAKGEALYVRPEYRPAGLFVLPRAHAFALAHGVSLLFGLTNERAGTMVQHLGFRKVTHRFQHRVRLLRPSDIDQFKGSRMQSAVGRIVTTAQQSMSQLAATLARAANMNIQVNPTDHLEYAFTHVRHARQVNSNGLWSVTQTEASLRWRHSAGLIDILTADPSGQDHLIITRGYPGRKVELVACNIRDLSLLRAVRVLHFVIAKAECEGAAAVCLAGDLHPQLRRASCILGFVPRSFSKTLYMTAKQPCVAHFPNYNWLFSL